MWFQINGENKYENDQFSREINNRSKTKFMEEKKLENLCNANRQMHKRQITVVRNSTIKKILKKKIHFATHKFIFIRSVNYYY